MCRSVVRLAGERGCPHGGTTLKLIEPLREPGTPGAKVGQTAEFEPAQASRQRDVAHMNRGSDIQLALEPVITRDELFVVTVPKLGVAQRFRPANGLPAECNRGAGPRCIAVPAPTLRKRPVAPYDESSTTATVPFP